MKAAHCQLRSAFALLALALSTALPAAATSFVMMPDAALTDLSPIIVEARVVAVESSPAPGTPSTDYLVEVQRILKGYTAGSTIVLRIEGGVRPDGLGLRIYGAPAFREGSRALLFLVEKADGTYGVNELMLGAFHQLAVDGRQIAMRDLGQAQQVSQGADGKLRFAPGADRPRDLERFASWVQDRVAGVTRPADYYVDLPASGLRQIHDEFTNIRDPSTNLPLRWNVFDTGGSVTFQASSTAQAGAPGGGYEAFQAGLNLWSSDPETPVRYLYGGTTDRQGGLDTFDNVNSILFNDPNSEVSAYSCANGGTLAKGGPWYDNTDTIRFKGTTYARIQGADIVVNNGIECFFQRSPNPEKAAEELFAHETGHTLGLGHSSEDQNETNATLRDALMFAFIHDDGRGARLNSDDRAILHQIYQLGGGSGGGGGGSSNTCVANATTLCLQKKRFKVQVDWQNQFDGSTGTGRAVSATDITGYFTFGDKSNIELLVKILDFGNTFKLFYGQLTNLKFTITVTDTKSGTSKTYVNTPGDCGGIDQNAFAPAQAASQASAVGKAVKAVKAKAGSCRADRNTLCLGSGRFAVTVDWRNPGDGSSGKGGAAALSPVVGTFFFTDPKNVELMTKILDFGNRFAFFYGTLSNLQYTIHVTDTVTGATKTYQNAGGNFCGGLDTNAF